MEAQLFELPNGTFGARKVLTLRAKLYAILTLVSFEISSILFRSAKNISIERIGYAFITFFAVCFVPIIWHLNREISNGFGEQILVNSDEILQVVVFRELKKFHKGADTHFSASREIRSEPGTLPGWVSLYTTGETHMLFVGVSFDECEKISRFLNEKLATLPTRIPTSTQTGGTSDMEMSSFDNENETIEDENIDDESVEVPFVEEDSEGHRRESGESNRALRNNEHAVAEP